MAIGIDGPGPLRPPGPMPVHQPAINGVQVDNSGVSVHVTKAQERGVNISIPSKAVSGGDLAAFMSVTLPPNGMPGPIIGGDPRPAPTATTIRINLQDGEKPNDIAKQLAAAIKSQAPTYSVSVKGHVVTVTPNLFEPLMQK